jgi:hypothetical protein
MPTKSAFIAATALLVAVGCSEASRSKRQTTPKKRTVETPSQLLRKHDATRNTTTLQIRAPMPPPNGYKAFLVAAGAFLGEAPKRLPREIMLGLRLTGESWQAIGCRRLKLIVGKKDLGAFGAQRTQQIGAGWLEEYVLATVPYTRAYAWAEALGKAQGTISLVACKIEHELTARELSLLRDLLRELRPNPAEPEPNRSAIEGSPAGSAKAMLSSRGQLPSPGPRQIPARRFPPLGSSADTSHVVAHSDFPTVGWDSGKSRSKSLNLSQLRRLRWLRRRSHLYQARRAW